MKKLKLSLSLIGFLLLCGVHAHTQNTISGIITDQDNGEVLIGATIICKEDPGLGTITDYNGEYSITLPDGCTEVIISYTGYNSVTAPIDGSSLSVSLLKGQILDEVVVIGYGTVKREDLTGAVQSVSAEEFNKGAITGPQQLLAGKVPGVTISTAGDPGGGSTIRIRGESSLRASNDPLFVIDGVPLQGGDISGGRNPLNFINPNDIESMTVLKDASATAIYGNRAAGGVIVITTKKGKTQESLKVGYTGSYNFGSVADQIDVLDADEYRSLLSETYEEGHPVFDLMGSANTNWQDEIFQNSSGTDQNINFSGGIKNLPYRLSLGYSDMNGLLKTDKFTRTTVGLNLNPSFMNNTLQINAGLKYMRSTNNFADRGAIGNALTMDPTQPVLDPDSPYGGFYTWTGVNGFPNNIAPTNPVALLSQKDDKSRVNRYIANFTADYRLPFLPALRANLNLAVDRSDGSGELIVPTTAAFEFDNINGGGRNKAYEQDKTNKLLEFYLNYNKDIGDKHNIDLMAGYSWQHFNVSFFETNSDIAGTPAETNIIDDPYEYYLVSLFGRMNYSFNDLILTTFTLRRDGTSRFSPENRYGLFPAAALAIKAINNDNPTFNNVKLRAGWGITGQEDIDDVYAYLARYQFGFDNAQYQFGDDFIQTLRPNGYDANIQWEETTTINFGVDISLVKNRVSTSIDVYNRDTEDLLNRIPVPAGTNLSNFVTTNVGNMTNKGVEVNLNLTPILSEKVTWDLNLNFARNTNEITRLTASDDPTYIGIRTGSIAGGVGSNIQIHSVGYAPYSFYAYQQLYDENGDVLEGEFADLNGDGTVTADDFYRIHNPAPDYTLGFSSQLNVGNFDFSFAGRVYQGNYIYNNILTEMAFLGRVFDSSGILRNVHQEAVANNYQEQANLTFSDHFIEDGSFIRVDHITLGYDLSHIWNNNNLRVFATVQNPILITDYSGLDPEITSGDKPGIDDKIYPRATNYVFGISAQF